MTEIFHPRKNMKRDGSAWRCHDYGGRLICDGGPSIIGIHGSWAFYISGIGFHRIDGPATSYGDWYINNINVTEKIHDFAKENNIDLKNLSDENKVLIALKFG